MGQELITVTESDFRNAVAGVALKAMVIGCCVGVVLGIGWGYLLWG